MKNIRLNLMTLIYQYDLYNSSNIKFNPEFTSEKEEEIYKDIIKNISEIDNTIEKNLYNYSLNRLSFLDRAIIRLATYEMLYSDLAIPIIINEAVNLSKEYTNLDDMKQHKFNNSLLDKIGKEIKR